MSKSKKTYKSYTKKKIDDPELFERGLNIILVLRGLFPVIYESDFTFAKFKSVWSERDLVTFPLLQHDDEYDYDYINELYDVAMENFSSNRLIDQVWCLYAVYTLYSCQKSKYKYQIPISIQNWARMGKFREKLSIIERPDPLNVLNALVEQNSFIYTMGPVPYNFQPETSSADVPYLNAGRLNLPYMFDSTNSDLSFYESIDSIFVPSESATDVSLENVEVLKNLKSIQKYSDDYDKVLSNLLGTAKPESQFLRNFNRILESTDNTSTLMSQIHVDFDT